MARYGRLGGASRVKVVLGVAWCGRHGRTGQGGVRLGVLGSGASGHVTACHGTAGWVRLGLLA